MIRNLFARIIPNLFSKMPVSFRWFFIFSLLFTSFQNCAPLNSPVSGDANSQSSPKLNSQDSGNGGVYGGLLPPVVPGLVQPGQKVVVAVLGGTGPFILKSKNHIGQFTQMDERKFLWEIPSDTVPQKDVLTVEDALSNQSETPVEIRILKQDDAIFNFGKSAVSVKGFTVMGAEDTSYQLGRPGCGKSGYLQVFNSQGEKASQVFPDPRLCDQFGAQLSTNGELVVASSIVTESNGGSSWTQQAGVTIFQMTNEGILIPEQTIISKRKLIWGWAGVGLQKDRLFISYASDARTGLVIEMYKRDPDEGWKPVAMIDFQNFSQYDTSAAYFTDGYKLVKFAEDSTDLIVQVGDRSNSQWTYLVFKESADSQWSLKESIAPFTLIPKAVRDLGTGIMVSNFQILGDRLFVSIRFSNVGDRMTRDRALVFKKGSNGIWAFDQEIGPEWANQSYNAILTSFVSGNYLVVYHEILHRLEVYRKLGDKYELYIDLTDVLMQNGFARAARVSGKKIIVPFYRSAYVFSLQ